MTAITSYHILGCFITLLMILQRVYCNDHEECKHCEMIAESFEKGMKITEHKSYGGGDVEWAKKKLGPYTTSEIRLMEIIEHLCDDFGNKKDRCQMTVGRWENRFEDWWKNNRKKYPSLRYFLCVMKLKLCKPLECNKGWEEATDEKVCADIDECKRQPCMRNQFCMNTPGSFTCVPCDKSCKGCYGVGPEMCKEFADKKENAPIKRSEVDTDANSKVKIQKTPAAPKKTNVDKKPVQSQNIKPEQRKNVNNDDEPIYNYLQNMSFYYLPHIIVGLTTSFFFIKNPLLAFLWIFCVILYRFREHLPVLSS